MTLKTVNQMKGDIKRLKLSKVCIQFLNGDWHVNATQGTIGHNFVGKDVSRVWDSMVRILGGKKHG